MLTDCEPEALEAVLRFCYMGECRLPKKEMLPLLVLADRLDIPGLTALCEKVPFPSNHDTDVVPINSSVTQLIYGTSNAIRQPVARMPGR